MSKVDLFEGNPADIAWFVREHILGLVISTKDHETLTTPLPLLSEVDENGAVRSFLGHFALSNRQVELIRHQPRALIVFQGPHAYIRPGWISQVGWAPTWNYALAQFEVDISLLPTESDSAIRTLVSTLEGESSDSWRVESVGVRYDSMVKRVIAFRANVVSSRGRFKLGQDESDQTFQEILSALGEEPIASLMRRFRRHREGM